MKKIFLFFVKAAMIVYSNAQGIDFSQIQNWTGSGNNVSMLVIDFNDGAAIECWAFGYRWDGTKTAENMINDIAAANPELSVNIAAGFLNDITFGTQIGIGGSPNFWTTFVFTGTIWEMNLNGIGETLTDSMMFGCSYTAWYQDVDSLWYPVHLPENPFPVPSGTGIFTDDVPTISIYPNPFSDFINFKSQEKISKIEIFDISGRKVMSVENQTKMSSINVDNLKSGVYILRLFSKNGNYQFQFVKYE